MGQLDESKTITLQELLATRLVQKDAVVKLLC